MLLKKSVLDAIVRGEITLQFRKWKRPTVKTGGRLKTAVGMIGIDRVEPVTRASLTERDARAAGFTSCEELLSTLERSAGRVYRIALHYQGADPRVSLRKTRISSEEDMAQLTERLNRMDKASRGSPWTKPYLELIGNHSGLPAADLAARVGCEKGPFKVRVRRLKELGLTESLETGYRLSARGRSYLARLKSSTRGRRQI